jgi:hypothetical protein
MSIESPLLFLCSVVCAENMRKEWDVDLEPLAFCTRWLVNCASIKRKPLASILDTLIIGQSFTKHCYA